MSVSIEQGILASVHEVVADAVAKTQEAAIQEALAAYEKRLRDTIGRTALTIGNYYDVTVDRGVITISVKIGTGA